MNITSDIGKQYDNIHSIYSDIVQTDTKTMVLEKTKPPTELEKLLIYFLEHMMTVSHFVIRLIILSMIMTALLFLMN